MTTQRLLLSTKSFLLFKPDNSDPNPFHFSTSSLPLFNSRALTFSISVNGRRRVNSFPPRQSRSSSGFASKDDFFFVQVLILFAFSSVLLVLRLFSAVLLPDFPRRWRNLLTLSQEAEDRTCDYPSHVWEAIVAYEDRRFFKHFGVDPVGIARAAVSFSAHGGGSTITQQLVKNTFLKNERTLSRKMVEMVLSLALERTISKRRILSCYMCKIYWGHGIHGIESASDFYFGKHPSLLTLGESALLAGIIPAPELRSPFRDRSRGKIFQARVLKRMVDVGFLDVKTALSVLKQPLSYVNGPLSVDGILHLSSFTGEELRGSTTLNQGYTDSTLRSVWDWEAESRIWETCEEMERWAMKIRQRHGIRWSPVTKFW